MLNTTEYKLKTISMADFLRRFQGNFELYYFMVNGTKVDSVGTIYFDSQQGILKFPNHNKEAIELQITLDSLIENIGTLSYRISNLDNVEDIKSVEFQINAQAS